MEFLFESLQGVSQCWWPGPRCHVNWQAWAVAVTVAAVLIPALQHERDRRESRLRENALRLEVTQAKGLAHEQAVRRFIGDIWNLRISLGNIRNMLDAGFGEDPPVPATEFADAMRLPRVAVPSFDGDPDLRQIAHACINLGVALSTYDGAVQTIATIGGDVPLAHSVKPHMGFVLDQMDRSIEHVVDAITASYPELGEQLRSP